MIAPGIIVSIQNYSYSTTQELAVCAIKGGAIAIRTDTSITIDVPVIALKKNSREYYITTRIEDIKECARFGDYVAIDCRRGNKQIDYLLAFCHMNEIKVVADIQNIDDYYNIKTICDGGRIKIPDYFATTFSSINKSYPDLDVCRAIRDNVIAEGGYSTKQQIENVKEYVNHICIGSAISDITSLTEKYNKIFRG